MKIFPIWNLWIESFSDFKIKICELSGVEFEKNFRNNRNNFLFFRDEIFMDRIWYSSESILIMTLEIKEEAIEFFGSKSLIRMKGFNLIKGDRVKWALSIYRYRIGQLYDFIEMWIGYFEIIKFAFECSNGIEHFVYCYKYESNRYYIN